MATVKARAAKVARAASGDEDEGEDQRRLIGRFGLPAAPGGLRLAQDLVNTALVEQVGDAELDRLADLDVANAWLGQVLRQWSETTGLQVPAIVFAAGDLPAVRELRERLRADLRATSDNAAPAASATPAASQAVKVAGTDSPAGADAPSRLAGRGSGVAIELTTRADGRIAYQPTDTGWRGLAALISVEALLAQTADTWSRLKACAHPVCGACFYDASPNRSRVWHDTKTCGNVSNLRASRTRRKAGPPGAKADVER